MGQFLSAIAEGQHQRKSHQTKSNPYFCVLCGSGAWQPAQILVRSPRGGGLDSSGATKISANGCSGLRALDLIRR